MRNWRVLMAAAVLGLAWLVWGLVAVAGTRPSKTVKAYMALKDGNRATGTVVEYDDDKIVLQRGSRTREVAWAAVTTDSAYVHKKRLLRAEREELAAQDYFDLGLFLLSRSDEARAQRDFARAVELDDAFKDRVETVLRDGPDALRPDRSDADKPADTPVDKPDTPDRPDRPDPPDAPATTGPAAGAPEAAGARGAGLRDPGKLQVYRPLTPEQHDAAVQRLKAFAATAQEALSLRLKLIETEHFLIYTDWTRSGRKDLSVWFEKLYAKMCHQFNLPEGTNVWEGKGQVFVFADRGDFFQFAHKIDHAPIGPGVGGYFTWTPHIHIVLFDLGDESLFGSVMTHEASHAFLHRYRTNRHVIGWLNEGLAELMAEVVLPDHCRNDQTARLYSTSFVRRRIPIRDLFGYKYSPPGQYYPIAYSLVEMLIIRDRKAFVQMINDIKGDEAGAMEPEAALEKHYDWDYRKLDQVWRHYIRKRFNVR